jgi:hypothetical protein
MEMNRVEIALTGGIGAIQKLLINKGIATEEEITQETNKVIEAMILAKKITEKQ